MFVYVSVGSPRIAAHLPDLAEADIPRTFARHAEAARSTGTQGAVLRGPFAAFCGDGIPARGNSDTFGEKNGHFPQVSNGIPVFAEILTRPDKRTHATPSCHPGGGAGGRMERTTWMLSSAVRLRSQLKTNNLPDLEGTRLGYDPLT